MTLTGRGVFSAGVGAIALVAIALSSQFNETARVFPIATGVLVFLVAALIFLADAFPEDRRLSFVRQQGVLNDGVEAGKMKLEEPDEKPVKWSVVVLGFASICGFVALMYYTSYLIAIPVFLIASIVFISKGKFLPALGVAIVTEALVYVIFEILL